MRTKKSKPIYEEEGTVTIKATVAGEDNLISKKKKPMRRLKCEKDLARIVIKAGNEHGFKMCSIHIPQSAFRNGA